jgi:Fe-S cluster assembly protein SufD
MTDSALPMDALRRAVTEMPVDRLAPVRQAALARLQKSGLPTTRHENWKYTDLSGVFDVAERALEAGSASPKDDGVQADIDAVKNSIDAHWLVIANGRIIGEPPPDLQKSGVEVVRFSESSATPSIDEPLTALNAALLEDGLSIRINAGADIGKPIAILVIDDTDATPGMSQVRVAIELAPNSHAQFVEYHASSGSAEHYSNTVIHLTLADDAKVEYLRVQKRNLNHSQTERMDIQLGCNSRLCHCGFDLGGKLSRNDLNIDIVGAGADASFNGLFMAGDRQHIDNHTRVDHRIGPARSTQEYRGILSGACRGVWNGKVIVHAGADGTDAQQANHNLLLSEKAEIDAKPELEIYADDVKCSHGTTVGQLDEAALFYLRSRGLDRRHARQMLTHAFVASVISKSPLPSVEGLLREMVEARLNELTASDTT